MCLCKAAAVHFVISTRCPLIRPSGHNWKKNPDCVGILEIDRSRYIKVFSFFGGEKTQTLAHLRLTAVTCYSLIVKRINIHTQWMPGAELIVKSSMCSPALFHTQLPSLSPLPHERAECWHRLHWEMVETVRVSSNYKTTAAKVWQLVVWHFAFPSLLKRNIKYLYVSQRIILPSAINIFWLIIMAHWVQHLLQCAPSIIHDAIINTLCLATISAFALRNVFIITSRCWFGKCWKLVLKSSRIYGQSN